MKRSRRQYLTLEEIQKVDEAFRLGLPAPVVAAQLKCGARSINRRFEKLRNGFVERCRKSAYRHAPKPENEKPKQSEAERRASRFYHSTFEL